MYSIYRISNNSRIRTTQSGIVSFDCYGNSNTDELYTFSVLALVSYNTIVMANIIDMNSGKHITYDGGKFSVTTSHHQSYFRKTYDVFDNVIHYTLSGDEKIKSSEYQAYSMIKWFEHTFNFSN